MATQITPRQNSKLGTNSKTVAGSSNVTVVRTGSGKSFDPYVDTVDLAGTLTTSITANTTNITTLQSDVNTLKASNSTTATDGKGESMTFNLDLSIASGGTQTVTITTIDIINLTNGTGYGSPTIASVDATLGKNNMFVVNDFMTTNHTNFIVQSTYEDGGGFDYQQLQEELDVQISGIASDTFYFRFVNKKGLPLTNLQLAKMGSLKIKFEIKGTNR